MASIAKTALGSVCSQTTGIIGNASGKTVVPMAKKSSVAVPKSLLNSQKYLCSRPSVSSNLLTGSMSVRFAHSDLSVPDFGAYRIEPSKGKHNFHKRERERKLERKSFYYTVTAGLGMGGVYCAKTFVTGIIGYVAPSANVLALGATEVPLEGIPEGKSMTFEWRGKPLFIRHRTQEEIDRESLVSMTELRDPETDDQRVQDPKWLVVIGVCTHLGCVPIADAGDYGGYYCPCHGSHYDGSGRIRRGPAPRNLEVPAYSIIDESVIRVG